MLHDESGAPKPALMPFPSPGWERNPQFYVSLDGAITCQRCQKTGKRLLVGGCSLELVEARLERFRATHEACR